MAVRLKLPRDRAVNARLLITGHTSKLPTVPLTAAAVRTAARGARTLTIISAFYDVKWCKELILSAEVPSVHLVVNGLGGVRLGRQKDELCKLQRTVAKKGIELDARLAFAPGIFHSKLVVIDRDTESVAFMGSANATRAAMDRNEEIVLRLTGDLRDLVDYAKRICAEHSTAAHEIADPIPTSLITFFRSGSLYYKSAASMQLTFNPFKDVERLLSRKQKARLGSVKLPHADGKTGISPFSLVRALKLGSEGRAVQAKIKPFYIETSLGYWVPDALANDLSRVLEDASRSKREAWTSRRDIILSTALQKVRARYVEYVEAIRDVLTDNEIYPEKLLPKGEDPFEAERFDRFFRSICRRLKNDAIFMRLIDPFHRAGVPEIWDDRAARVEFEESFFTYLEFATSLPRCPRVPRTLLNQLPKHPTAAPDIKSALRKRLKRGWDADIWV